MNMPMTTFNWSITPSEDSIKAMLFSLKYEGHNTSLYHAQFSQNFIKLTHTPKVDKKLHSLCFKETTLPLLALYWLLGIAFWSYIIIHVSSILKSPRFSTMLLMHAFLHLILAYPYYSWFILVLFQQSV